MCTAPWGPVIDVRRFISVVYYYNYYYWFTINRNASRPNAVLRARAPRHVLLGKGHRYEKNKFSLNTSKGTEKTSRGKGTISVPLEVSGPQNEFQ